MPCSPTRWLSPIGLVMGHGHDRLNRLRPGGRASTGGPTVVAGRAAVALVDAGAPITLVDSLRAPGPAHRVRALHPTRHVRGSPPPR